MQLTGHSASMSLEDISSTSPVRTRWGCYAVSDSQSGPADMEPGSTQALDHLSSSSYSASRGVPHYADPRSEFPEEENSLEDHRIAGEWQASARPGTPPAPAPQTTTTQVMVRNILNRYTKKDLMEFLDNSGLKGTYNGVYLPIGRTRKGKSSNLGYAFVDFRTLAHVDLCCQLLNGVQLGAANNQKRIEVVPASAQYPSRKFHKCPKKTSETDEASDLVSGTSMLSANSIGLPNGLGLGPISNHQGPFQPQQQQQQQGFQPYYQEQQSNPAPDFYQHELYHLDQMQQTYEAQPLTQQPYQHQFQQSIPPQPRSQQPQYPWQSSQQQQQQPQGQQGPFPLEGGHTGQWAQPLGGQFELGLAADSNLLGANPTNARAAGPGQMPRHLTSLSPCESYLDEARVGRFSV